MCQTENGPHSVKNLESLIDRFSSWISNVDQKAGILISLLGILLTILFTSRFVSVVKESIVLPFLSYFSNSQDYSFSLSHTLFFLACLATLVFGIISIIFALRTLKATITPDGYNDIKETVSSSHIFFGSISKMSYEEYVSNNNNYDYLQDLLTQVYINACICNLKFERYNKSLLYFRYFFISLVVLLLLYFFI